MVMDGFEGAYEAIPCMLYCAHSRRLKGVGPRWFYLILAVMFDVAVIRVPN